LAVFLVMFLIYLTSPSAHGEFEAPAAMTLGGELNLDSGTTEAGRPYLGSPEAEVTFYEFGDFQCPHCGRYAREQADEIEADYLATGKARMVWVNHPIFDGSETVAKMALCAADRGAFWDLHDWLFANQSSVAGSGNLSRERLPMLAEKVGLDWTELEGCIDDPATQERLDADMEFGTENGVGSTPTFLIGERLVEGNQIEELRDALDSAAGE
jgi:protein-disulfide isomerase